LYTKIYEVSVSTFKVKMEERAKRTTNERIDIQTSKCDYKRLTSVSTLKGGSTYVSSPQSQKWWGTTNKRIGAQTITTNYK